MEKLQKAIFNCLVLLGEIATGAKVAETEIADLINHTKIFMEEVQKPRVSDRLSAELAEDLRRQQKAYATIASSPVVANNINNQAVLSKEQSEELQFVFKSMQDLEIKFAPEKPHLKGSTHKTSRLKVPAVKLAVGDKVIIPGKLGVWTVIEDVPYANVCQVQLGSNSATAIFVKSDDLQPATFAP